MLLTCDNNFQVKAVATSVEPSESYATKYYLSFFLCKEKSLFQ